jgi:hypothetical protein
LDMDELISPLLLSLPLLWWAYHRLLTIGSEQV